MEKVCTYVDVKINVERWSYLNSIILILYTFDILKLENKALNSAYLLTTTAVCWVVN